MSSFQLATTMKPLPTSADPLLRRAAVHRAKTIGNWKVLSALYRPVSSWCSRFESLLFAKLPGLHSQRLAWRLCPFPHFFFPGWSQSHICGKAQPPPNRAIRLASWFWLPIPDHFWKINLWMQLVLRRCGVLLQSKRAPVLRQGFVFRLPYCRLKWAECRGSRFQFGLLILALLVAPLLLRAVLEEIGVCGCGALQMLRKKWDPIATRTYWRTTSTPLF